MQESQSSENVKNTFGYSGSFLILVILKVTMTLFLSRLQVIRMDFQETGMVNIYIFYI